MGLSQLLSNYKQYRSQQELGLRFRNAVQSFASKVGPVVGRIIPNFRAAHYTYVFAMTFLGSFIIFPQHNISYVDTLFISTGAATQAGLNTIDTNKLKLYQQIVIYVFTCLTTPIFIHGFVLFLRLWWFERYFDDIKESSKQNFKMRRSATLANARSRSFSSTYLNTANNRGLGLNPHPSAQNKETPQSSTSTKPSDVVHISEPSDSEHEHENNGENSHTPDIRFGNLPHPPSKRVRQKDVDPSDMYRSIAMLRHNQTEHTPSIQFSDPHRPHDDDEVLIIKSPNEIENNSHTPIFTKRARRRSSNNLASPKKFRDSAMKWKKRSNEKWTQKLKSMSSRNRTDDETDEDDDDLSIDSETRQQDEYDDIDGALDGDDELEEDESKVERRASLSEEQPHRNKFFRTSTNENPRGHKLRKSVSRLRRIATPSMYRSRSMATDDEEEAIDSDLPSLSKVMSTSYLSWVPTVGKNSTFVHLSDEQKEELGGVEYRAVKLLTRILIFYYIGFHCLAFVLLLPWILHKPQYIAILRNQGISPTWWAFFSGQSAFNDLGITLTEDSMISFNQSVYVMIVISFFVVIGNTGFPVLLRFIIWILFKFAKPLSLFKESLGFLLDHPRRCFTLLFPSLPTWWLFFILIVLNAVDLVLYIVLDLKNKYVTSTPVGYRILQGLFQAFNTRTAGFTIDDLSHLHPAVQVSYMIMMYISVLPLAISIRRTNVYEEQSLGIYLRDENNEEMDDKPKTFVGAHLRNQLSFDLWFIFLGLFIICICESSKLDKDNIRFSVFSILFEIISAYGTVGLSLGYPNVNASLTSQFTVLSKLVIIAMMIRGRHRGLPYSLDRAIMLPDNHMNRRDKIQENHAIRSNTMERSATLLEANTLDDTDSSRGLLKRTITKLADHLRPDSARWRDYQERRWLDKERERQRADAEERASNPRANSFQGTTKPASSRRASTVKPSNRSARSAHESVGHPEEPLPTTHLDGYEIHELDSIEPAQHTS